MFINKAADGNNNLCGAQIAAFRKEMHISQRELADRLTAAGLTVDKNAIQRIECGKRFITDIELVTLCSVLDKTVYELMGIPEEKKSRKKHTAK